MRAFYRAHALTICPLPAAVALARSGIGRDILLRKEVIQPQVPLRLPCYDFIPITPHTFGAFLSLLCELVQRLRVHKAFMM